MSTATTPTGPSKAEQFMNSPLVAWVSLICGYSSESSFHWSQCWEVLSDSTERARAVHMQERLNNGI